MKVSFGSIQIGPGGMEPVAGLSINGQQVNDPIQYYRAAATVFRPRGLRSTTLGITVRRMFNTVRDARRFAHQHFYDLPQQGDLYLFLNESDSSDNVLYAAAVVDAVAPTLNGLGVDIVYNFSAGAPSFSAPPPTFVPPDDTAMKYGTAVIPSGNETVAVVFAAPFSSTPTIPNPGIQIPDGGAFITAVVIASSISTTGFTAQLSAATPASGYKMSWTAFP